MATVLGRTEQVEQYVILHNVSWETYERLLNEHAESSDTRFSYDRGALEIMILSLKHERIKHLIETLVELLAAELGIDIEGAGSTTFRRKDLARGFEPDACFYIEHAPLIRTREEIDPMSDPPPDLVIEIDIAHPSLNKFPIFSGLRVPEIWRYHEDQVTIFRLEDESYVPRMESTALRGITGQQLSELIADGKTMKRPEWLKRVRGRPG